MSTKVLNKLFFDPATKLGSGNYTSIQTCLDFLMEPTGEGGPDSNKPSHVVYYETQRGPVEIGKAWSKTIKSGNQQGALMYSVTMDDGDLPRILNFAAYPETDNTGRVIPGEYNVVRERHRREQKAA
jgi:uncharacterized protein (DUF736 family)